MMDEIGMVVWGLLSSFLGVLLIFPIILAAVAGVKWIRGQKMPFDRGGGGGLPSTF